MRLPPRWNFSDHVVMFAAPEAHVSLPGSPRVTAVPLATAGQPRPRPALPWGLRWSPQAVSLTTGDRSARRWGPCAPCGRPEPDPRLRLRVPSHSPPARRLEPSLLRGALAERRHRNRRPDSPTARLSWGGLGWLPGQGTARRRGGHPRGFLGRGDAGCRERGAGSQEGTALAPGLDAAAGRRAPAERNRRLKSL